MGYAELSWERKRVVIFGWKTMKKGVFPVANPAGKPPSQAKWHGGLDWISKQRFDARLWVSSSLEI